jgi:hypothetical protein
MIVFIGPCRTGSQSSGPRSLISQGDRIARADGRPPCIGTVVEPRFWPSGSCLPSTFIGGLLFSPDDIDWGE